MTDLKIAFGGLSIGLGLVVAGRSAQIIIGNGGLGLTWYLTVTSALLIGTGWWIFRQLWKEKP